MPLQPSAPKFCVDCAYYDRRGYDDIDCSRPLFGRRDVVTGQYARLGTSAWGERRPTRLFGRERCGPEAIFFVPASDDRSPERQDAEERLDAQHESAVGASSAETPNLDRPNSSGGIQQ